MELENAEKRTVLLGVTGSIAAYKAAQLSSNLQKKQYDVHVLMTANAAKLIAPATFETLTGNRVSMDTFDRNFEWNVQHISLAKRGELFLIAPATANVIAKAAAGIADDMLTTTLLAARCPKIVCPAMNTGMYENPATQENLRVLKSRGFLIVEPESGLLACGDTGKGRFPSYEAVEDAVEFALCREKPLAGKRVLVNAGATREELDPVRFLTNHSTGKMGYALARAARNFGAQVTLVSANSALPDPVGVETVRVRSARELYEAMTERFPDADAAVLAAAVADYRPAERADQKLKKTDGELILRLERTEDILASLCARRKPGQIVCGFSMETERLKENSRKKLEKKGCDLIAANSLSGTGTGFGTDTNAAWLITRDGEREIPLMSKDALAAEILREVSRMLSKC